MKRIFHSLLVNTVSFNPIFWDLVGKSKIAYKAGMIRFEHWQGGFFFFFFFEHKVIGLSECLPRKDCTCSK